MSKKHTVRSYYDRYASNYDKFYQKIQHQKFLHIQSYIDFSSYLVDLGGGSGIVADWTTTPLINIDISTSMIRSGLSHRSFLGLTADLEKLPLRKSCIDHFISLTAYQNTSDLSLAINELSRILSDKSKGVLTLLNKKVSLDEIESIFTSSEILFDQIPFGGEDYCFIIHQ